MSNSITTQIIKIGNSQGVRIPKLVLEQAGLHGTIQLEIKEEGLLLRSVRVARQGWEEQYLRMAENGDDALLDGDIPSMTKWDETEWEW